MTPEVQKRIKQIRRGEVPEGYKKTICGIVPSDWSICSIGDCLERVVRPVQVQEEEMYTQIGIRSHGKGLFYKEPVNGAVLGKKAVFWIEPDCLIVNIVFAWEQAIGKTKQAEAGMIGSHRFPMYRPIKEKVIDIDYLITFLLTKRGTEILEAASPGGAGRNKTLGQERFLKSKIVLPPYAEQLRIADILSTQDQLIELLGKKTEQLQKMKKYCLNKMFPKCGESEPEIRFSGYTGAWEQRELGSCFDFLQNNTLSRADLNSESGIAKNIHYGDVLIKFGEYLDTSKVALPYITSQQLLDKFRGSLLRDGDVIMADTAEDESVGKCTEITGLQEIPILSGLHTIPLRPKGTFASGFLGYYMNSGAYRNQLLPLMQGIKVTSISKGSLKKTDVIFPPDTEEQAAIGKYFIILDHLITLHQRKLEAEKQKKKALMQLLLTGIVRV